MKARPLLVLAPALALACASPPSVGVPRTPEGQACVRECMTTDNTCRAGRLDPFQASYCDQQWHDCLMTCPGAHE